MNKYLFLSIFVDFVDACLVMNEEFVIVSEIK